MAGTAMGRAALPTGRARVLRVLSAPAAPGRTHRRAARMAGVTRVHAEFLSPALRECAGAVGRPQHGAGRGDRSATADVPRKTRAVSVHTLRLHGTAAVPYAAS